MAMGAINWLIEGKVFSTTGPGKVVSDVTALNGWALSANVLTDPAGSWAITNILPLPAGQAYRAYVRLKISDTAVISEVARLEVVANGDQLIGLHRLRGVDFRANDAYQEFHVDFNYFNDTAGETLEFRVIFNDVVDLAFDRLVVFDYPTNYEAVIDSPYNQLRLKVIDDAGNVSSDLTAYFPETETSIFLPLIIR
jgi:hypothetical protein